MPINPTETFCRPRIERARRRGPPARSGTRRSDPVRVRFHAPSFSGGVLLGALVVLTTAYLPELLESGTEAPADATVATPPELTFEFDDLLRNSRITPDAERYRNDPAPETGETVEYMLQAASFRASDDAERLRAALLLMDLPATTRTISLDNGTWYRVTVGPFATRVQADRAMTRLREQNLAAIRTQRTVTP